MKEFDVSRRRFLTGSATALSGLAISLGLARYGFAADAQVTKQTLLENYRPTFFHEAEWKCIVAACDRLIPSDETGPGAVEALVPVYIDRQMNTEYGTGGLWYMQGPFYPDTAPEFGYQYRFTPRDIYRIGLKEVADHCRTSHDKAFDEMEAEAQTELLKNLESGSIELPSIPSAIFFRQLLANTKEGFFSDPMYGGNENMAGWKMVGFPGAQGDYREAITRHNQALNIAPVSIEGQEG